MATVVRENIGLLTDKLVIKIEKNDYLPSFEKKLKEYSKQANIPGFRKGMVPAGMIKKMYGASIFNDEVLRTVEKELFAYLNQEKPEIFAQPLPIATESKSLDMNNPSEYEFDFEIGLKPAFEVPSLAKGKFKLHNVEISDTMLDEEINRMRIKGGKMTEPELIDNEENVLNIIFTESDKEGKIVEGGINKENSVLVKYLSPSIQKEVMGKKAGDSLVFRLDKAFEKDKLDSMIQDLGLDPADKESAKKYFKLEIIKVGLIEKRELDETFFNEVFPGREFKTEEEFRNALSEEMIQYWGSQSRNQLHDQIYHYLVDETKMEFPEAFLKRWLQTDGEQKKTPEQAEKDFPAFSNQLKWTLISDRILKENKLEVSDDELRDHMKTEVMRYFGQAGMGQDLSWLDSYLDRMMKDEKQVDATYRRIISEKMFQWAETQVKPEEKKVTIDELNAMQHHHSH